MNAACILQEFVDAAHTIERIEDYDHLEIHYIDAAWAGGKSSSRRLEIRLERAAARPPCPHCGAKVERVGGSAKIPKYCSTKCSRAARFARWWAKNGEARNEQRRTTEPNGPDSGNASKGVK